MSYAWRILQVWDWSSLLRTGICCIPPSCRHLLLLLPFVSLAYGIYIFMSPGSQFIGLFLIWSVQLHWPWSSSILPLPLLEYVRIFNVSPTFSIDLVLVCLGVSDVMKSVWWWGFSAFGTHFARVYFTYMHEGFFQPGFAMCCTSPSCRYALLLVLLSHATFSTLCFLAVSWIADPCLFVLIFSDPPTSSVPCLSAGLRNMFLCHKTDMPPFGECSPHGYIKVIPPLWLCLFPSVASEVQVLGILHPRSIYKASFIFDFVLKPESLSVIHVLFLLFIDPMARNTSQNAQNAICPLFFFTCYALFRVWHVHWFSRSKKTSLYGLPVSLITPISCCLHYGFSTSPLKKTSAMS